MLSGRFASLDQGTVPRRHGDVDGLRLRRATHSIMAAEVKAETVQVSIIRRLASTMHAACIRVLLSLALGAALLLASSGYARRRRAVIKLISSACGLTDKRRVSPHPGLVRLAQDAKVDRSLRVETGETNCGTLLVLRLLGPGS